MAPLLWGAHARGLCVLRKATCRGTRCHDDGDDDDDDDHDDDADDDDDDDDEDDYEDDYDLHDILGVLRC